MSTGPFFPREFANPYYVAPNIMCCDVPISSTNAINVCSIVPRRIWVRRGCIGSCWGNRREGDHWGELGVNEWILGWISRRWDVGIWTGLGWPKIGTGGGRL